MDIIKFEYEGREVRTIQDENGEIHFVAQDVCDVLGLVWKGSGTLGPLDDDEKGVSQISTPGGKQEVLTVNESGLYALVFRSNKSDAKKFRRWITHEVLPTIRKTGSYTHPNAEPTLAQLAGQITRASKALGSDRLTPGETWALASSIVSALFGVNAAQMLGQAEVEPCFRRPSGSLEQRRLNEDVPILSFGRCKADGKYRTVLDPELLIWFGENCCQMEPGIAAPEWELYDLFREWCKVDLGLEESFSRDLFHDMLERGWFHQRFRFQKITIAGEIWWMGIAPRTKIVEPPPKKLKVFGPKKLASADA